VVARGIEKGPLEEGVIVCQVDTLDGAPVTSKAQQEAVGVKDAEEVAVGKMWRPRLPAKTLLEAVGVEDAEGVAKITVVGDVELLVLEDPVVAAAGGREEGSMEDGIAVCRMDALEGAPVIATDQKEDVLVQGDPVLPAVDQKVDALVVEGMQAISVKGNGKEEKDKEGIKWLKHYSTAQSILIIGDGDFSFSLALATTFGSGWNLVATSLDSYGLISFLFFLAACDMTKYALCVQTSTGANLDDDTTLFLDMGTILA
jgi:25S rRNA (uracil2634-N3)-methyltransferase